MPRSAITPFTEDIQRAKSLIAHARSLPQGTVQEKLLRDDIRRSGWMFAVGAMDAYFCDAYTDLIAATLMAKSNQPSGSFPDFVGRIKIPVTAVLENYKVRQNWKWRMAARRMMAQEDALELETIRKWFNPFFSTGNKFYSELIPSWIMKPGATARIFSISGTGFQAAIGPAKDTAHKSATKKFKTRFDSIVQRRHDCIHTCDRPASTPQPIDSEGTVANVIKDVQFIVEQSDAHIDAQFKVWLVGCGFTPVTVNKVGY